MSKQPKTMRAPSDQYAMFAWWRAAITASRRLAITSEPQCGFYKRKMTKGGVFVPVAIWLDQPCDSETGELADDEKLLCLVDGDMADAESQWSYCAGHPIPESADMSNPANAINLNNEKDTPQ